jgi:hypothetical protein
MSLSETGDGGWVLDAVKGPIRPDLGPLARDRLDSTARWVSLRDLEDFSMQGIRP